MSHQTSPEVVDALITETVGLVPYIAKRVRNQFPLRTPAPDVDDLISVGHFALVIAANRYIDDHPSGATFQGFAYAYIKGAMVGSVLRPEGRRPTSGKIFWCDLEDAMGLSGSHSPEMYLYWREVRQGLHRAIAALPFEERQVMALHYVWDLSPPEIADRLRLDQSKVRSLIYAALKTLRKSTKDLMHSSLRERSRRFSCPKCQSSETNPYGRGSRGQRRRRCRSCKAVFIPIPTSRRFEDHRHFAVV